MSDLKRLVRENFQEEIDDVAKISLKQGIEQGVQKSILSMLNNGFDEKDVMFALNVKENDIKAAKGML